MLDKEFHKLAKLVPTKGVERSLSTILGFSIIKWDLGGQEQYRSEYLKPRSNVLLEAELVVFLVDIQEVNSYPEALEYYKKVLNKLKENEENPHLLICLHKADPEVCEKYKNNIRDLIKLFEGVSKGWDYKFYTTSIYNRRSIVEAFSYGISLFLPKKKSLDYIIRNFIAESQGAGVLGVMLWDHNAFFLNMVFEDKKAETASLTASMGILETIESFGSSEMGFQSLTLEVNKEFQFVVNRVGELFTTIVGHNIDFEKVWQLYEEHYLTNLEEIIEKDE